MRHRGIIAESSKFPRCRRSKSTPTVIVIVSVAFRFVFIVLVGFRTNLAEK